MDKKKYILRGGGKVLDGHREYWAGDVIELSDKDAESFGADRLEPVGDNEREVKIYEYKTLRRLTNRLRDDLKDKEFVLLFAYNGIGKTRLSMSFKDAGKKDGRPDTLYFNAFTEDLFSWDNDLDNDTQMVLKLNSESRFFSGLQELEMDNRIRPLLRRYADFDFRIDTENWTVSFEREVKNGETSETVENIKISRGEENIFIWCFFLAIAQIAIDKDEDSAYEWVKYIYIDDPILY